MRRRLHQPLDPTAYQVVRDNRTWPDHRARTLATGGVIAWFEPNTVCDPACGDGSIVLAAHRLYRLRKAFLNDISEPQMADLAARDLGLDVVLTSGDALEHVANVDLVVLTEILEHLERPEDLLARARGNAKWLVASSPVNEMHADNHEHVWAWDKAGYREMLVAAGWQPVAYQELSFEPPYYTFGIWACT